MNCMNAYLNLVDHALPLQAPAQAPDVQASMTHLLSYAHECILMPFEVSWRLEKQACKDLEIRSGMRPAGGWRELCSLAAGARLLNAVPDGFLPNTSLEILANQNTATIRTQLLESFTHFLAPPSTAANLFVLMGLHPIWGLRIASESLKRFPKLADSIRLGERDDSVFPPTVLSVLQTTVYETIACIVATLRRLEPNKAYCIDALGTLIDATTQHCRRRAEAKLKHIQPMGLPVFVPFELLEDGLQASSHPRALDFSTFAFLQQIFVPAGAIQRFDDGTFTVFEAAFDNILVGSMNDEAQNKCFARFLSDPSVQYQVA